jgi:hypothetical protein
MDIWKAVDITTPAIAAAQSARQGGVLLDVPDFGRKRSPVCSD